MKKLPNKLAANVRKIKEQSVVAPAPVDRSKPATDTQTVSGVSAPGEVAAAPAGPPSQLHPVRVWPD